MAILFSLTNSCTTTRTALVSAIIEETGGVFCVGPARGAGIMFKKLLLQSVQKVYFEHPEKLGETVKKSCIFCN